MTVPKVSFDNSDARFVQALRHKVNAYFDSNNIKRTGNASLFIKTGILFVLAIALYGLLIFAGLPVWLALVLCATEGFVFATIGFNVMHDGAHGSFSSRAWVNKAMGYSLNLMGGNVHIWQQKHNLIHHSFTNIDGLDDDIDIKPWIRTNHNQPKYLIHRYQHIYWGFLYGLTYLAWVFLLDFKKYFSGKIAGSPLKRMNLRRHVVFWFSKLMHIFLFLVLPAFVWGPVGALAGYLLFSFVCGLVISIVFQLAHVVEGTSFPMPEGETDQIPSHWAIHQLESTANFSTGNKLVFWLTGGLNFQIEHHLFPRISHVHYPAISRIVRDVCGPFRVTYLEYPTVGSALRSHVSYLKGLGRTVDPRRGFGAAGRGQ